MKSILTKANINSFLQITFGVFLVAVAFYFFLSPAKLVVGGVMGIAILVNESTGFSETLLIYMANIVLLFLGLFFLGKRFFLKTIYGTLLSPTIMAILELCQIDRTIIYNQISSGNQLLIVCVISSFLSGIGLGLVLRNGASTGGMDVPEKILSYKLHIPISYVMYVLDGAIIAIGFAVNVESGIFAIISLFMVGYLIDIFSVGGSARRAFYIITDEAETIKKAIYEKINRGVTIVDCKGGFTNSSKKMIICISSKSEYSYLRFIVSQVDSKAFMYISKANEVIGEGFSKEETI